MENLKPILMIVSAPSGAGKTTLVAKLLQEYPDIHLSKSYTTRPARSGEVEGEQYHFISSEEFQSMVTREEFAEHAKVHQHDYGTPKKELDIFRNGRQDVIVEIDWQGARSIHNLYPQAISVFIKPPDLKELRSRLQSRGKDSQEVIEKRLAFAREEISKACEFDYIIINDDFSQTYETLRTIYIAAHYMARLHCSE